MGIGKMTTQTFNTLVVATAATGVGLGQCSYSDVMRVGEFVLGHPVWTHELADKGTTSRIEAAIRAQLPNLPSRELAHEDWQKAATAATEAYGETVTLTEGTGERTENPVDSLARLTGRPEDIIVVTAKATA